MSVLPTPVVASTRPRQEGRRSTQRERLLAGMVATANRAGYAGANVSKVIAEAGVSRPTFYEYFDDRDDCFREALQEIQQRLLLTIREALAQHPPQQAIQASLAAIIEFASAEPAQALFLTSQAMAAGPLVLDARDEGIAAIEQTIDAAQQRLDPADITPDVSPRVLVGGLYRLLASRLRRGEPGLGKATDELTAWASSYARPIGTHSWRSLTPRPAPAAPADLALGPLPAPGPLPPGRPALSKEEVAANHRDRILHAAAQLAEQKGYNAATIADITRKAGVDGRAFYAAFADKQDAFMAVHEIGVQHVMSATAAAFFTGTSWPERIWEGGRAFAGFLERNPMIAHVGFVEAYAVGPAAVQRVEDSHVTFTIFLQEGYQQQSPPKPSPSRLALEAIITSIFEIVYREARRSGDPRPTDMLGHMAFLALAPFLGAEDASEFINERLQRSARISPARRGRPERAAASSAMTAWREPIDDGSFR
jgi:AcrR family transcriptional regulator